VRVLVTRPRDQVEHLAHLIEQQGGEAIRFPVIEIAEPKDTQALHAVIGRLDQFGLAIFISPNAVNRAMNLIRVRGGLPAALRVACVGRGRRGNALSSSAARADANCSAICSRRAAPTSNTPNATGARARTPISRRC
jgi:ATP phosphoribosyltransferase regulatory subunit HisZ